jgi:methylisocitrate lyase
MRTQERAGLAGIHIEDQVSPKRCGHLDGKSVIESGEMERKVRAAVDSKQDESFIVCARTDARSVEGLDAAIERAKAYVGAGADAVFPEGLQTEGEFEAFRKGIEAPLLANMTEFGKTPIIPFQRFRDLGYQMVIYPMTAFRVMLKAVDECYAELVKSGTQAGILDRMRTREELYQRIEYSAYDAIDKSWE